MDDGKRARGRMTTRLPSRATATSAAETNISGRWRITEMDLWDQEAIDLLGPAFIEDVRAGKAWEENRDQR